jgi:hypothetical protein
MDLLAHAPDHRNRLAEVHLSMAGRMRQRYKSLLGAQLRAAHVILHHRVAAGKPMLGLRALEDPLGRMSLLRRSRHIRRQNGIDDRDQGAELRLARRFVAHITRRRRKPAHL